ncbi:MAG: rhomboid family intramembrane serine protease [Nocardioides sp.]|uniref:rhomboid family intramembrane serine protease n=1 Tax=Nocardioides sp. TaxID=35761 RepID=UPI0032636BEA
MSTSPYARRSPEWRLAGVWSAGFVGVLWLSEMIDTLLNHRLDSEGIRPGSTDGLSGILFAPLLHGGFGHLIANTGPLLVLGFLVLLSGLRQWVAVTAAVWLIGGIGTWLFGGAGTVHIGASGLVFGWLAYLIVRGFFNRQPAQILVGVAVFLVYGGALWGVLPGQPGISWQGHLFGAVGGVVVAWRLAARERTPPGR